MTKSERHELMRSEARFDRKRGKSAILFSGKDGVLFRYYIVRKNFWRKFTSLEEYHMLRGLYELG